MASETALRGCSAWTFRVSKSQCWTKDAAADATSDADCVSGGGAPAAPFAVWPLKNMTAQLYNLTRDPWEREDVSAAHPDVVQELRARLAQWGSGARDPYYRTAKVDTLADPAKRALPGNWYPSLP